MRSIGGAGVRKTMDKWKIVAESWLWGRQDRASAPSSQHVAGLDARQPAHGGSCRDQQE
ncbi:hypothetical protein JOF53_001792 [Crossiella equi]|uniref:Uncharacterized protein n=1 Tax=Crossiella equi TaxID=130796 RepID=A0ABS5A8K4_9PSEU|nr:hypothetical protein [Crossiella equi]MBP2472920.1 hypothetical protein [Crossiella equi]